MAQGIRYRNPGNPNPLMYYGAPGAASTPYDIASYGLGRAPINASTPAGPVGLQARWRQNVSLPLGGSPTNLQEPLGGPYEGGIDWEGTQPFQFGNILDWLAGQGIVTGGSAYQPADYGTSPEVRWQQPTGVDIASLGLGSTPANASTGLSYGDMASYGLGRTPTNASTAEPSAYLAEPMAYSGEAYPAAAYRSRHSPDPIRYNPDQTPTGGDGGRFEFTYDNIRDLERGLKEAGYTGQTIYKDGDVIRRDGQGRILSITRGASGGGKRIGWSPPNQRNKSRRGGNAVGTDWDRQSRSSSKYVDRNKFARPDWIKTMSNWRGI